MMILAYTWCIVLTLGLYVVAWKAKKANRSLWRIFEQERKRINQALSMETRQWQMAYGRLLAVHMKMDSPVKFTSQHGEDVYLVDYFAGLESGVFIEIGAYDGITFSNTYALEQLGWHGLLVEAHPKNAAQCRGNRPKAVVAHAAVGGSNASGVISFNAVEGRGGDLLSFVSADAKHLARCIREGSGIRQVEVPYRSLASLFEEHCITKVDFLSIDIEGAEIEAINGLPLETIRPRLILVEANDELARAALRAAMLPTGYREIKQFEANLLFEDLQIPDNAGIETSI